jgi:hypothetical protein
MAKAGRGAISTTSGSGCEPVLICDFASGCEIAHTRNVNGTLNRSNLDLHGRLIMAYADIFHDVDIHGTTLKDSYEERREADRRARAYVEAEALAGPTNPSVIAHLGR